MENSNKSSGFIKRSPIASAVKRRERNNSFSETILTHEKCVKINFAVFIFENGVGKFILLTEGKH